MTNLEERIHSGLHETAERIPEAGIRLKDTPAKRMRPMGAWMAAAAVVAVLALFSPIVFLDRSAGPPTSPGGTTTPSTAAPTTIDQTVAAEPDNLDRFPVMVEAEETGVLIGLERGHAFKSTDGGDSWTEILVDGGADLIDVAPDGTVLAISNSEESTEAFGPSSSVREAPTIHIYDPVADEWQPTELPRPEFPADDPQPEPLDGSGDCPLGGIQWTLDALSLAIGNQYVIAGEQRITEESICDQSFQFFWTSQDLATWTITESTGIPGYLVGITSFNGTFVAYGSDIPWYSFDQSRTLQIWTSGDLVNWKPADIDLSTLPTNGYPAFFPDEEASISVGFTVVSAVTDGMLRLNVPIGLAAPGPGASTMNIDELIRWAEANGRGSYSSDDLKATLESMNIGFPLDDSELDKLTNFFASDEGYGHLIIETDNGVSWTSRYEDR